MNDPNTWVAPCGINCSNCSIHSRTEEELSYWKSQNVDLNSIWCDGCRSDRTKSHWSPDCKLLECCVYQKHLDFCSDCSEFPCQTYRDWAAEDDHHRKAYEYLLEKKGP